jgi:hypothetical protein
VAQDTNPVDSEEGFDDGRIPVLPYTGIRPIRWYKPWEYEFDAKNDCISVSRREMRHTTTAETVNALTKRHQILPECPL